MRRDLPDPCLTRSAAAWVAAALLVSGPGAAAFELPGVGTLVGISDPFAVFPDSLPPHGSLRSRVEARELYRYRRGPEFQDVDVWSTQSLVLVRGGRGWFGVRFATAGLALDRREVYREEDVFRGRRATEHVAAALATRTRWGELRGLIGGSGGPEAGVRWRGRAGPAGLVTAWWWIAQGEVDLSQKVHETTFFFPFQYHENAVGADWERRVLRTTVRARLTYRRLDGEEPHERQYNRLDLDRWHAILTVERPGATGPDASVSFDRARAGIEMTLDGTIYARARDLRGRKFGGEVGWRTERWGRLGAGYERWDLRSDDESFVDIWPFTIWDVFSATRYRLESLDAGLDLFHVNARWSRELHGISVALHTRFEWWNAKGDLFWKKRVPTFPPFFFRFDHYVDDLGATPTNAVQGDAAVRCPLGRGAFVLLEGQIVAPFSRRDRGGAVVPGPPDPEPGPPPAPSEPESVRGGLRFVATLGADW